MSTIVKFVEIAVAVLLGGVLIFTVYKVLLSGTRFQQNEFQKTNESYLSTQEQDMISVLSYGEPIPITTIYATLIKYKDSLHSLKLNYYVKNSSNQLELTTQTIDVTKGGVVNGTTLDANSYRTYTLGQLRYLFTERALVEGERDEEKDTYDLIITQEPRDFQTTNVPK